MDIVRTLTFKEYEGGALINESKVKQGSIRTIVEDEVKNATSLIFGSSELPMGDKRLKEQF